VCRKITRKESGKKERKEFVEGAERRSEKRKRKEEAERGSGKRKRKEGE